MCLFLNRSLFPPSICIFSLTLSLSFVICYLFRCYLSPWSLLRYRNGNMWMHVSNLLTQLHKMSSVSDDLIFSLPDCRTHHLLFFVVLTQRDTTYRHTHADSLSVFVCVCGLVTSIYSSHCTDGINPHHLHRPPNMHKLTHMPSHSVLIFLRQQSISIKAYQLCRRRLIKEVLPDVTAINDFICSFVNDLLVLKCSGSTKDQNDRCVCFSLALWGRRRIVGCIRLHLALNSFSQAVSALRSVLKSDWNVSKILCP